KIQAWLAYLMDQARLTEEAEPILRNFVIYGFFQLKTWWAIEYGNRVEKHVTKRTGQNGLPEYDYEAREGRRLKYEGFRFQLVDPYDAILDLRETDPRKMEFIGDSCTMNEAEVENLTNLGVYDGNVVDQMLEEGEATANLRPETDARKAARSMSARAFMDEAGGRQDVEGAPRRFRVEEIWCLWRPTPSDEVDEYVLTIANGRWPLRVQKNPYDDKHRPYAVARSSKEPHDFLNVGVLDHAIRVESELDDHENLALQSHVKALCPFVFAPSDYDGPRSLWNVEPGQVFRVNMQNGAPVFAKAPTTLAEHLPMKESLRRDIEEITGTPRIYEGTGEGHTATEIERKIQEGNRRIRRMVIAAADGFRQLLEHGYALSQQYMTRHRGFRVLGKDALALPRYQVIRPEDLTDPIDFKIHGVQGLQWHGLRATQMTAFLTQTAPLLPEVMRSGQFNTGAFIGEVFEALLGYRLGEHILKPPPSLETMLDQHQENELMLSGHDVEVHPADDDEEHIEVLGDFITYLLRRNADEEVLERAYTHYGQHVTQQRKKQLQKVAAQQFTPAFPPGAAAEPNAGGEGRGDQVPDLAGDVPQGTPPGETPGPGRLTQFGAPDRTQPVPQTVNRAGGAPR